MKPVTFGRALALGGRAAFARATPPLLAALAAAVGAVASTLLWAGSLGVLVGARDGTLVVGLLLVLAIAWLLQAAVLGGAVLQAKATLRLQPVPSFPEAILRAAPRALGWAALAAAALLAWQGWQLGVGGSGALLFLRGLAGGRGGLAGALALALAASVGSLGTVFLQLVSELALVRAVARDEPSAVAGWEAGSGLLARPWVPLGLLVLTGVLAAAVGGLAATLGGMGAPFIARYRAPTTLLEVAIAALATSVAQLVRLGAFAALELDRSGELPAPPAPPRPVVPRAELVLEAEPVLEARAVGPPPESAG
jgi:hypothetical protein